MSNPYEKIQRELTILAEQICTALKAILASSVGINDRTGTNTLVDSNLYNTIDYNVHSDVVDIIVAHYAVYINNGLRPGVWVPIRALRDWAFRKGLPTDNSFIYAVQRSIYNRGIKARPILYHLESQIDSVWAEWADNVFVELVKDMDKEVWSK